MDGAGHRDGGGSDHGRGVVSPGLSHEDPATKLRVAKMEEQLLDQREATRYRAGAARFNYLAADRRDLGYATKELARGMAKPSEADLFKLKRAVWYLRDHRRGVQLFKWQKRPTQLVCETDSDWAGCTKTRRSTSGGILFHGSHPIGHWSRTQPVVALSSGEAEMYSALKGGCELLGADNLLREWGRSLELVLRRDSSACKGVLSREGCGKIKHLEVKQLWLQQHVASGRITFEKIPRNVNAADTLTEHWSSDAKAHFTRTGFYTTNE